VSRDGTRVGVAQPRRERSPAVQIHPSRNRGISRASVAARRNRGESSPMAARPPLDGASRLPRSFWLSMALLVPEAILRGITIQASLRCSAGTYGARLFSSYALLLLVAWLFRTIPPAVAVVAAGTAVITVLPLAIGLLDLVRRWPPLGVSCGEGGLLPGLFVALQLIGADFVGLSAVSVRVAFRARARPQWSPAAGRVAEPCGFSLATARDPPVGDSRPVAPTATWKKGPAPAGP
jgi:hypothetical protein